MSKCNVIAVENQKGGTGKSTTVLNLGVGLTRQGKRVLLIDADPQGSLSISLGIARPDDYDVTLSTVLTNVMEDKSFDDDLGIIETEEGVDLLPYFLFLITKKATMLAMTSTPQITTGTTLAVLHSAYSSSSSLRSETSKVIFLPSTVPFLYALILAGISTEILTLKMSLMSYPWICP